MQCKQCGSELTGRQRDFCSGKCAKRASRTKPRPEDAPQSTNADTMAVNHPPNADKPKSDSQSRTSRTQDQSLPMTASEVLARRDGYKGVWPPDPEDDIEPAPSIDGNVLAGKPTLAHYHARPDLYITRREPDKLNWGAWMDSNELSKAGLKANRVAIPGDWDFKEAA